MLKMLRDFMLEPAVIVGLIVLAGLFLQKKSFDSIIKGTVKSMIGFMIIRIGGNIIAECVNGFGEMFQYGFHVSGMILSVEGITGIAVDRYGMQIAVLMFLGVFVNLVLARITRFRYVFVTGQEILYMASLIVVILNGAGVQNWIFYVIGSLAMGISMVLSPAVLQPYTRKICGNDSVAIGHFGSITYLIAAWIGKIYGENSKSTEEMKISKNLSFLRDSSIMVFIVMLLMYVFVALDCGSSYIEKTLSDGKNFIVYSVMEALTFTVGFVVVITGIRWFINEIVPAVKGIADNWIPNARAAVDCPILFTYAPNALIIGFITSFLGGLLSMGIMIACNLPVILPGVIPHFFCGATAAVYGNSTGGRRGAILGSLFNGIIMSFFPVIFLNYLGDFSKYSVTFSEPDMGFVGSILGDWLNRLGSVETLVILTGIVIIMILVPEMVDDMEKNGDAWYDFDADEVLKESKIIKEHDREKKD